MEDFVDFNLKKLWGRREFYYFSEYDEFIILVKMLQLVWWRTPAFPNLA